MRKKCAGGHSLSDEKDEHRDCRAGENYENTKFCGADLLEPCTDVEKVFAPQRYVVEGGDMYKPLSSEEQALYLQEHCRKIEAQKVVCYCMSCLDGIKRGGKQAYHLIELLFPA